MISNKREALGLWGFLRISWFKIKV